MSEPVYLGNVITILDSKPAVLSVQFIKKAPDTGDPLNQRPYIYRFDNTQHIEGVVSSFLVVITDRLATLVFRNNMGNMHNGAIQYGLYSIRKNPTQTEFLFTTNEHEIFQSIPKIQGLELRKEVLRFFYTVYTYLPGKGMGLPDLADNFSNPEQELNDWLIDLWKADKLIEAGGNDFRLHRGHANMTCYRINPIKASDVGKELDEEPTPWTRTRLIRINDHRHYKILDIGQKLKEGFAFVIMPFNESEFNQSIMDDAFKPVVADVLNIPCIRSDSEKVTHFLENLIYTYIVRSDVVIADLSTQNPNVIFEFGLALALEKEVIAVFDNKYKAKGKPAFDYEHYGTLFYNDYEDLKTRLRAKLPAFKK